MGLGNAPWLPAENSPSTFSGYLEHQRRVLFEGRVADPLPDDHNHPPGLEMVLLLRIVMQDGMSDVPNVYPQLKLRAYVNDSNDSRLVKEPRSLPGSADGGEQAHSRSEVQVVTDRGRKGRKEQTHCVQIPSEIQNFPDA